MTDRSRLGTGSGSRPLAAPVIDDPVVWAALESGPDGIVICDRDGILLLVNRQLEDLSGYDRAELLGQPVEVLIPDAVRGRHRAHRLGYRVEPAPRAMGRGIELHLRRRDGREVPIEIALAPVESSEGLLTVATLRDVSDARRRERENRAVLDLLDLSPDALMIVRAETQRLEYANVAAEGLTGYSRDELMRMTTYHFSPRATPQNIAAMRAHLRETGDAQDLADGVIRRKDGTDIDIETSIRQTAAHADGGERWVVVVRDVTDRLAQQAKLTASEEAFRAAFEQAPVAMAVTSLDPAAPLAIRRANQAFADLLQVPLETLVQTAISDYDYPEDSEHAAQALGRIRRGEQREYEREKRYRRADGTDVWVEVHATGLRNPDGTVTTSLGHIIDVSDRRRHADHQRRRATMRERTNSVAETLLRNASEAEFFDAVASAALDVFQATSTSIMTAGADGDLRVVASAGTAQPALATFRVSRDHPVVAASLEIGSVTTGHEPIPELADALRNGIGPWLVVPIESTEQIIAMLCVGRPPGATTFDSLDDELARDFAREISTLAELNQTRRAAERMQVYDERERIARDVHDHTIQRLFSTGMSLQGYLARSNDPESERLAPLIDDIDESIRQLRGLIFRLHSTRTDARELEAKVRRAIEQAPRSPACSLRTAFELAADLEVSAETLDAVEAIVNESLSNIARHANASNADLSIVASADQLTVSVTDDGDGIDPAKPRGRGLDNISHRAAALGGHCTISTIAAPSHGTSIAWTVPLR